MTRTKAEYVKFYSLCIESLKQKLPGEFASPSTKSYYQIPTGLGGVHFEWAFHGRPRSSFGVELHFEKADRAQNQKLITACSQLKERLEKEIGSPVVVMNEWGNRWARLYVEKLEGKMTDTLKLWAVDTMEKMIQLLQPELDKVKGN